MKNLITVLIVMLPLISFGQTKEAWADIDSLNAKEYFVVTDTPIVEFIEVHSTISDTVLTNTALQDIDSLALNEFGFFGLPFQSSDPTPIREGQQYFNTTSKTVRTWNGTAWIE